jgi:aspartyl-tRNA(Asn)/glutamyl-tRNA(Gln) amidotransferase subunit A
VTLDQQLDLCFASIVDLQPRLEAGDLSPVELTEAVLQRIERHNDEMRIYISVLREVALGQARQAEEELRAGENRGPLHGIPIGLKDNVATKGIRTSCASLVNPDWLPDGDAAVYVKLREAGAILVGKANLFEYAFSMNDAFPQPLNPWNPARTSSGSSSGSAVSVATGMAHGSIGSDTGGSGRAPANVNGVVGLKPTYGRVSRAGIVPLSFSLDNASVFARCVADASIMIEAISGHDSRDEYSADVPVPDMRAKLARPIAGMRVGVARGYSVEGIDPEVDAVMATAVDVLAGLGAQVEDVTIPFVEHAVALQAAIMLPEVASVHQRAHRETPERFGATALMRMDLGSAIPATAYVRAQQMRKLLRNEFRKMFERIDVIVGPANAARAGDAGSWMTKIGDEELDLREVGPEYTGIYNLAGNPAIVVPAGFASDGTPIGLQIAGRWFDEPTILQVAHAFEQATEWHTHRPPLPIE